MPMKALQSFVPENAIHPIISFDIEIDYRESKIAIISIGGWLKTKNGLRLAAISETRTKKSAPDTFENPQYPLSASHTSQDLTLFKDGKYSTEVSAQLDEKAVLQIDNDRMSHPYKAVELKLDITIRYLKSNALVPSFLNIPMPSEILAQIKSNPQIGPNDKSIDLVVSVDREKFTSSRDKGWIISGDNSPTFLYVGISTMECDHKIDLEHWTNEYAPKLGLGRRILFEVASDGELFDKMLPYLSAAEDAFMRWDTKSVFAYCREIGNGINNHVKESCKDNPFIYKERWGRFYAHFENAASLDLHIEDIKMKDAYKNKNIGIGRPDAECLLIQTKNLIKYAQEIIKMR